MYPHVLSVKGNVCEIVLSLGSLHVDFIYRFGGFSELFPSASKFELKCLNKQRLGTETNNVVWSLRNGDVEDASYYRRPLNTIYLNTALYNDGPNISRPSGTRETVASPNEISCEAEGCGGSDGKQINKRKVGKYRLFRSGQVMFYF